MTGRGPHLSTDPHARGPRWKAPRRTAIASGLSGTASVLPPISKNVLPPKQPFATGSNGSKADVLTVEQKEQIRNGVVRG
jgi:hypothetical protein